MTGFPLSEGPLQFGEIRFGSTDYNEFVCSKSTASWLLAGGMRKVDGKNVQVRVMDTIGQGQNVVVGFWFTDNPEDT